MGSKTQANTKQLRPVNRCEECKRDFLTVSALKAHISSKHPEEIDEDEMPADNAEKKDEKKTAFVPPTSRISKRLQQKKSTDTKDVEDDQKSDNNVDQSKVKTVFECPSCCLDFSVYFLAFKHIQKHHCVDEAGNPVEPTSSKMIRPIPKEVIVKTSPRSTAPSQSQDNGSYSCLACKHIFTNVASFDLHVEANHKENVTSFTLSSMIEFHTWKSNIEAKQKLKYLSLSNTAQKQYYQCNYVSPQNSADITHLCPSMIIIRELAQGIKISFYKEHYEHTCENVMLPNDNPKTSDNVADDFERCLKKGEDVYGKIKDILQNVIDKASTFKKKQLKPLYSLAVKMQDSLNSLDSNKAVTNHSINEAVKSVPNEDLDEFNELTSKSMTDDQIRKELEAPRNSARLKRKTEGSPVREIKKKKDVPKTRLKENDSSDLNGERLGSPRPNIASPFTQSPSFNDSYRQFIETSSPKTELEDVKTKKQASKTEKDSPTAKKVKKEVVKTKIGQFSPRKSVTKTDTEYVVKRKKFRAANRSKSSLDNVKLEEVDFEVVEQENDCNILILKI